MRNVDRIPSFMYELGKIWGDTVPDWRFGQLMFNFIQSEGDPFYWEEEEFLERFKKYVEKHKQK